MAKITILESVRTALKEEMQRDERVFVIGQDVGVLGGVFRATKGLIDDFGESRVIDAPLAESGIVGVAIGAAVNGMLPVAEIQFADFIYPAVDQIVSEAAKWRYRTNGEQGCPLVIRAPYGGDIHGGLYHSQCVEAMFFGVPGLKIVAPSNPYDTKGLLKASIRDEDPVLFLEHKKTYRSIKGEVPEDDYEVPIGEATIRREGADITLVTFGLMVHRSMKAATALADEGVEVEVIDLRTLWPLDMKAIIESVKKTSKAIVVHEDNLTGGIGGEIAARIGDEAFEHLDGPVRRLGAPDVPAMPFAQSLETAVFPDVEKIAASLRGLAAY